MTTLIEENKLLQQQLMEAEEKGRRDSKLLQNEIEKLSEKARRKQERYVVSFNFWLQFSNCKKLS